MEGGLKPMTNITQNLITVNSKNEQTVDARELWRFLQIETPFTQWFDRMLAYGYEEGVDYRKTKSFSQKSEKSSTTQFPIVSTGRKTHDYTLTMGMAKELCMLQRNEMGRKARKYFIEVEKAYKDKLIVRQTGKLTRRTLTDTIRDNLPDSPNKKFAYKSFTDLAYRVAFGKTAKQIRIELGLSTDDNIRDKLTAEQLKRLDFTENVIQGYVGLGYDYATIKNIVMMRLE